MGGTGVVRLRAVLSLVSRTAARVQGQDDVGAAGEADPPSPAANRRWPRLLLVLLLAPLLAAPVAAHELEPHHVLVQAGPYPVEVGFSEWPVLAERAVDITFLPEGGIAGKTAALALVPPGGDEQAYRLSGPLGRHPRQRDFWGLDLIALPAEGEWTLALTVDGPAGPGEAALPLPVGPRPGPPPLPMWLLGILPAAAIAALVAAGWRRVRPGRTPAAAVWT